MTDARRLTRSTDRLMAPTIVVRRFMENSKLQTIKRIPLAGKRLRLSFLIRAVVGGDKEIVEQESRSESLLRESRLLLQQRLQDISLLIWRAAPLTRLCLVIQRQEGWREGRKRKERVRKESSTADGESSPFLTYRSSYQRLMALVMIVNLAAY